MSNYSTNHCSITPLPGETQAKNIEEFAWNKPYGGNEDSWQLTPEEEARLKKMELSRKERGLSSVETPEEKIERLKWEAENEELKEEITSKKKKTVEEIKKAITEKY